MICKSSIIIIGIFAITSMGYSLLDNYYGNVLKFYKDNPLPYVNINYPGFYRDTSEKTIGLGFYDHIISYPGYGSSEKKFDGVPYKTIGLNDFYLWSEKSIKTGKIGFLLSDINLSADRSNRTQNSSSNNDYEDAKNKNLHANGAIWLLPNNSILRGVSIECKSGINSSRSSRQSTYNSYQTSQDIYENNRDYEYVDATSSLLLGLKSGKKIKLSVSGEYYKNNDSSVRYSSYPYYSSSNNSIHIYSAKGMGADVSLNLIDTSARVLGISISSYADNQNYTFTDYRPVFFGRGHVGLGFHYADSKLITNGNYSANLGIVADFMIRQSANTNEYLSFFELKDKIKHSNRTISAYASIPILISAKLFNSSFSLFTLVTPNLWISDYYEDIASNGYTTKIDNKNLGFDISVLALGLKGKIGNKIDVAFTPSLKDNIFVTGLELKYNLQRTIKE